MSQTTESFVPARRDPYSALRIRDFRLLILGRLIAQIGEAMVSVGVGWELYRRTSDPLALGLVGLVQVIPVMLLALPGGYAVDRFDRRRIILISQAFLVVCSLALLMISVSEGSLTVLYAMLALIGAARAFNNPAESAFTPLTVPPSEFMNAVTWSTSVWQVSAIVGPALGGVLIALTGGAAAVYLVNAIAGLALIGAVLLIHARHTEFASPDEPPLQALRGGIHFLRDTPIILAAISLDMFAVLFGGAVFLLPVFATDILKVDATGLGILRAAPSIGALIMAMIVARRPPFQNAGRAMLLAVAGFGAATVAFGLSTSFWLSVFLLALTGALDNISVVVRHTLIMTFTPDTMRGRVASVNSVFIGTSNELGGFESGAAAALIGPVGAVVFGGIGTILTVALIARLSPGLRRLKRIAHGAESSQTAL
ncbi:MAG: MFS transporter [Anaerolineae bacterium]|nr:MFS transporter [Anaerolineae bacterium]NUQ04919.1 MFS transporter [Anaerolineae bacterium]